MSSFDAGSWTLLRVAREAGVPRGVARAAVRDGLLRTSNWGPADVLVLKACAEAMRFPAPEPAQTAERNVSLARIVRGIALDPEQADGVHVVLGGAKVSIVETPETLPQVHARFPAGETLLVLPVGAWLRGL